MDRIAATIGRVKGLCYDAKREIRRILTANEAYPANALEALRKTHAKIEEAIEALEAWYRDDAGLEGAGKGLCDMWESASGPAPSNPTEQAPGLADWPGVGCAPKSSSSVPPASRRISRPHGATDIIDPAQKSDAMQRDGLAGAGSWE